MYKKINADLLLRIGVAFAFFYPPVSAFFDPYAWVGYFPPFVNSLPGIDSLMLLHIFGAIEIILGFWILFGKRIAYPSLIAAFMLAAIVVLNFNQMDVLFRDIPILLMCVALYLNHAPQKKHG